MIGESIATCWFAQIARSKLNQIELDTPRFNQLFTIDGYNLNTTSAYRYIKLFQDKLGKNKDLVYNFWYEDVNV